MIIKQLLVIEQPRSISSKFNMSAGLSQIFLAQLSLVEDNLAASAIVHVILVNKPCNLVLSNFIFHPLLCLFIVSYSLIRARNN
ncbi:hypothetical protein Peur_053083 [Populus x canadensis]